MEKKSIEPYFTFGTCVRYLQDVEAGRKIFGDSYVLPNITRFLGELDQLGLTVTSIAARDLRQFKTKLEKLTDKSSQLSQQQADDLTNIIFTLRKTLQAELQTLEAFIVTPKRFDIDKLLNDVGSLMAPGVFRALPPITQYDLSEAGNCIAFDRPTAAAFHLLRATEAVLRHFYFTLIRTKRVSPLLWGDVVQDLRTRIKTKKHIVLYNNLDNIRHSYRNPTQHPEAIYDIHEAQDLLPLCLEVIGRMIRILP